VHGDIITAGCVCVMRDDIRRLQLELTQVSAQTATQEEKIETLFDIYNLNMANKE